MVIWRNINGLWYQQYVFKMADPPPAADPSAAMRKFCRLAELAKDGK